MVWGEFALKRDVYKIEQRYDVTSEKYYCVVVSQQKHFADDNREIPEKLLVDSYSPANAGEDYCAKLSLF